MVTSFLQKSMFGQAYLNMQNYFLISVPSTMASQGGRLLAGVAIMFTYFATLLILHREMPKGNSSQSELEASLEIERLNSGEGPVSPKMAQFVPTQKRSQEDPVLKVTPNKRESSKSPLTKPAQPKRNNQKASKATTLKAKHDGKGSSMPPKGAHTGNRKGLYLKSSVNKRKQRFQYQHLKLDSLNRTNHFRGDVFFSGKLGSRKHIMPYLLGAQIDTRRFKKRVLLDLGATAFPSSVKWFLDNYPGGFTDVHAFEMESGAFKPPPPGSPVLRGAKITVHETKAGVVNTRDSVDIVDFILNKAKLEVGDFVVIKMDIEGDEWEVLKHMERKKVFPFIDEMFVDLHYNHPRMHRYGWHVFKHTRDDAYNLYKHLREDLGVFAHPWP